MIDWRLTLEDGEFWLEVRETVDCLPDRGLVLLSQDDGEGLPAAGAVGQAREDVQEELVPGSDLQPAPRGGQLGSRVDFHVVESHAGDMMRWE